MLNTRVRMGGTVMKMTERFLYSCNDQCGRLGGSARARLTYLHTEHHM